ASRNGLAPQVMLYWLMSAAMASEAARFRTSGAGKSGKPCARLVAPESSASRVISRMTDSVKLLVRALRKRVLRAVTVEDTLRAYLKIRGRRGGLFDLSHYVAGAVAQFSQIEPGEARGDGASDQKRKGQSKKHDEGECLRLGLLDVEKAQGHDAHGLKESEIAGSVGYHGPK